MKPFTTLKRNNEVIVWRKTQSNLSTVVAKDVGKVFTVTSFEYGGRRHNKFISFVYLMDKTGRKVCACVDELSRCNPNFEPDGKFLVCVGCGALVTETELKPVKHLEGESSCPSCGILDPTSS